MVTAVARGRMRYGQRALEGIDRQLGPAASRHAPRIRAADRPAAEPADRIWVDLSLHRLRLELDPAGVDSRCGPVVAHRLERSGPDLQGGRASGLELILAGRMHLQRREHTVAL